MKKLTLITLAVTTLFGLAGCGTNNKTSSSNSGGTAAEEQTEITAVGSTALQPLVEKIKEIYETDNPEYTISVQGGGSGTGLSQVSAGAVDIGNSDVFAEEKEGIDVDKIVDNQVAVVGIGPVVNKEVGVADITKQDLKDIFIGQITNWKELGGIDQEIVVVNRAEGSGTRTTFEQWGLDGEASMTSQEQDSSGTVRKIVSETPGAISYLAFSYFDDSVTALKIDGVDATDENVLTNDWKIWSYEHMYTQKDASESVQKFIDYVLSDDVQDNVVGQLNYIPITDMKVERALDGTITEVE